MSVKTRQPGQRGARQTTELDPGPVATSRAEALGERNALSDCAFTVRARPPLAFTLPLAAIHACPSRLHTPHAASHIRTASPLLLPPSSLRYARLSTESSLLHFLAHIKVTSRR